MKIPARTTKTGAEIPEFQIDDCFADDVAKFTWSLAGGRTKNYLRSGYREGVNQKIRYLHRYVWELSGRTPVNMIDHINGDTFDNRLENLRPASDVLNALNRRPSSRGLPQGV